MKIAVDTSLGDLVTTHPELARELERRNLDYCCGGARTLADACAAQGLDAEMVAGELTTLAAPPARPAWADLDAVGLVDHLVDTHHRYLWDELPRLERLVAKIVEVHGERHPELTDVAACFAEIKADLEPHLLKEERVLFPIIREMSAATDLPQFHCGSVGNPIAVMRMEHDTVGELLARLRQLTNGYQPPADGCATYTACFEGLAQLEADTHQHVHKENNRLFPLAMALESRLAAAR